MRNGDRLPGSDNIARQILRLMLEEAMNVSQGSG
jgi:hypothetical protein